MVITASSSIGASQIKEEVVMIDGNYKCNTTLDLLWLAKLYDKHQVVIDGNYTTVIRSIIRFVVSLRHWDISVLRERRTRRDLQVTKSLARCLLNPSLSDADCWHADCKFTIRREFAAQGHLRSAPTATGYDV